MALLEPQDIEAKLKKLPVEWAVVGGAQLQLSLEFNDFEEALSYVNEIGRVAEEQNHHPDIQLSYGRVELSVSTHSEGGLTKKDFEFAEAIKDIK